MLGPFPMSLGCDSAFYIFDFSGPWQLFPTQRAPQTNETFPECIKSIIVDLKRMKIAFFLNKLLILFRRQRFSSGNIKIP